MLAAEKPEVIGTGSKRTSITDHLNNLGVGAGALSIAGAGALVALHETRVAHGVGGGRDPDTTLGFLQNHGKDEPVVDLGLLSDLLDGGLEVRGLGLGVVRAPAVVGAGLGDDLLVGSPPRNWLVDGGAEWSGHASIHLVEGQPVGLGGPSGSNRAVSGVQSVRVRGGALAILIVDGAHSQGADSHHGVGGTGGQRLSSLGDLQGPSSQRGGGRDAGEGADGKGLAEVGY